MSEARDERAAEYVLGTLPADERARVEADLPHDATLRRAVEDWQARLAPLDETAAVEMPPASVWEAIARATAPGGAPAPDADGTVVLLRRRLARWRVASVALGALAAALAVFAILDRPPPPPAAGGRYVAVVDSGGREPALLAEVDTETGTILIRSLTAETPPGHSLELWHIPEGQSPRSLGVLKVSAGGQTIKDAVAKKGPVNGLIAVTVEPQGGSPSGKPTGEVVYSGRLIPVE